jgi:hypothetical protein
MGDVTLRFKGEADFSQARGEVKNFSTQLQSAFSTSAVRGLTGDFAQLTRQIPLVGGALSGVTRELGNMTAASLSTGEAMSTATLALGAGSAAAIALTVAVAGVEYGVYKAASRFADFAKQVRDMEVETGLSARTVSTLYAAVDFLSNTSMPQVNKAIDIYLAKLGEAAHNNPAAAKTFERFGIDAKTAIQNPDQAVVSLINNLAKIPNSAERLDEVRQLAGRGGAALADLAEQVRKMGGSFEEFQKQAEEWGVVLSEEDVEAAERFKESMTIMGEKVEGIVYHIGRAAMPEIGKAIDDLNAALGTNILNWQSWEIAVAVEVARVRGVFEGFAKWWKGNTWSPWQMGKDIEDSANNAELGAVTDWAAAQQRAKDERPPQRQPTTGSDIPARARRTRDRSAQYQQREIQQDERDELDQHRQITEELKRSYDRRIIDRDEYVKQSKEEIETHYAIQSEDYDREAVPIARTVKDKKEQHEKLSEVERKRKDALRQYEHDIQKTEDDAADRQHAAAVARAAALASVADASDQRSIADVQDRVNTQVELESKGEKEIGEIQLRMHDRAVGLLKDHLATLEKGSAEYNRVQGEIAKAEVERAALAEEVSRRVVAARVRETEADFQRLLTMRDLLTQTMAEDAANRRAEIEAAARENRFPSRSQRATVIRALADADRAAEEARQKQRLEEIENQLTENEKQAKTEADFLRAQEIYHRQLENEERRHQQAMGQINDSEAEQQKQLDPFQPFKDRWDAFKTGIEHSGDSIKDSIAGISASVNQAFDDLKGAFAQAIEANILYGQSVGKAMEQALAAEMAHVAAEAWIESLRHAAWAIGSLAFGDFGAAAKHAAAAAAFAGIAALLGKAAGGLAKASGMRDGSTASGSAVASTASPTPNNQTFTYNQTAQGSGVPGVGNSGVGEIVNRLDRLERAVVESNDRNARLIATATERNTQALSTFETASPNDILQRSADTTQGVQIMGHAAHQHLANSHAFKNNIRRISEGEPGREMNG